MHLSSVRLAAFVTTLYGSTMVVSALSVPPRNGHADSKPLPSTKNMETACNGHAELCDRSYGNTTFLGSHDSFAFSGNPLALARTQEVDLTTQMKAGARLLQAQAHLNKDELHFCHTTCGLFDGGTVEKYLGTVKSFLDSNPNEVMTFIFTNPENLSLDKYWKPAFDKSGMTPLLYVPPKLPVKRDEWPTLGEMIKSGKRVVVFLDRGAHNATATGKSAQPASHSAVKTTSTAVSSVAKAVPTTKPNAEGDDGTSDDKKPKRPTDPAPNSNSGSGNDPDSGNSDSSNESDQLDRRAAGEFVLPEFQMVWEDPFSSTNDKFPCHVDRTEGPLESADQLNMINHNLNTKILPFGPGILLSDRLNAPKTNGMNSILAHANGCASFAGGRAPNFVLLDYVNLGQGMETVNKLNGF